MNDAITIVVPVVGMMTVLMLFPAPVPYFPFVGALLYPADIIQGAFVGMVAGLFFGTVQLLMKAVLSNRR